jgi:hypothetical protein
MTVPVKQPQSWLAIYGGQTCCGHILNRGKAGWEAFNRDDRSLGIFQTQADAVNALDQQSNSGGGQ